MSGHHPTRDPFVVAIGRRIAELRADGGMTQQALAEAISTGLRGLQRIEVGEREPRLTTLRRIAVALKVPITLFFEPPRERTNGRGRPRKNAD